MKLNMKILRQCVDKTTFINVVCYCNNDVISTAKHVYKKDKYEAYRLLTYHMTKPQALSYAIYAAESALPQVERRHRDRALAAINAAKAVLENDTEENRNAAADAAHAANAADAAYAAAHAVAYAAYAVAYAADAARAAYYADSSITTKNALFNKSKEILG